MGVLAKRNAADAISLVRLLLAPFAAALVVYNPPRGLVFGTALFLTDVADGVVARRLGSNPWGPSLDAMVDKWLLIWLQMPVVHHKLMPVWVLPVIFLREILATLMRCVASRNGLKMKTSFFGKMKSIAVPMTLFVVLFDGPIAPGSGVTLLQVTGARTPRWLCL